MAEARKWDHCAQHCGALLETTANAAALLVKATMERRGVAADRSHDIARLASAFAAQRPNENALAQEMAALNGDSRSHHTARYRFRPPEVPDARAAVKRLAGTLDLWASEVETGADSMTAQQPALARFAADQAAAWPDLVGVWVQPKADDGHPAQAAAEAALEGRPPLAEAIASFRDRMRRVLEGAAPGDDLPGA